MNEEKAHHRLLTMPETISLGIGTMIGAGIFALFGNISALAGGYSWLAFTCAGIISALTGYSYYKLSHVSKTNGGLAEYLNMGWKRGATGRVISLCYFFSIIIVLGLVAKAFGHYTVVLLKIDASLVNILATMIMLIFLVVNISGTKIVARIETVLVIFKVIVLLGFIGICAYYFNGATYAANDAAVPFNLGNFINAVALANVSFAGFAVIANAGGSVKQGERIIGRAVMIAIIVVSLIYIALGVTILGNMSIAKLIHAKDYALAQAALPVLGQFGFILLAITAIVSTSTNINANTMSAANTITYMSHERQLSSKLSHIIIGKRGNWAMIGAVALVIVMIFTLDLSQIGDVASLTFLLVHTFIPLGNVLTVAKETEANKFILWLAVLANGAVMVYFTIHLIGKDNLGLMLFAGVIILSYLLQWYYQKKHSTEQIA